jgi:aldehyde:ferredoxin oxidoreductase
MYAVTGKMLIVNLHTQKCAFEDIPVELYREYLGGYGLGSALLLDRMDPRCDPLGSENILGFATGYLTGTGAYIASRYMVFGKSPSTGGWGDANCGGHVGKKMKQAGVDVILFTERASRPAYLYLDKGKAQILSADDLWQRDCYETEDMLKDKHGADCVVACIGPAGENMAMVAGISTDKGRFAARSSLGAVMGSKKLKAVVLKGEAPIENAHPEEMKKLRKKYLPLFKEEFGADLTRYGTPMFYEGALKSGDAPFKNWSSSVEELGEFKTTADRVLSYQVKRYACSGCPVGCGGHVEVKDGKYRTDGLVHKVEYETMGMFGSNLLNDDVESLIRINDLCNRYGMDTIGTGGLCSFAVECFEKGYIKGEQADGLELRWGHASDVVKLVEKIGKSEGIGAVLAKGFDAAVQTFGEETRPFAIAARGEALPAHDPRWESGIALTYFLDPTPGRHTQGSTTFPLAGYDMPKIPVHESKGRANHHDKNINLSHALNAAGLCLFGYFIVPYQALPEFLSAADGMPWTMEELERLGFRIAMTRQIFNVRAGQEIDRYDFPERALGNPPLETGETKGVRVDLRTLVKEYLETAGLDPKTGLASREVLESLHIERFMP